MEVTLGGDRLGSGNKQKQYLHNFERSTHNLSQRFSTPMGCGMLIPCLCIPALRGDVYDININGACRTLPTNSPLFSTFKMQVDILQAPVRLYQGILHNNPLFIGLQMKDVKFPVLQIESKTKSISKWVNNKFADNCLLKYLGMSGLGTTVPTGSDYLTMRKINAIPALAYYDICKNYYCNKQEENAYVITTEKVAVNNYAYGMTCEVYNTESETTTQITGNLNNGYRTFNTYTQATEDDTCEVTIVCKANDYAEVRILYANGGALDNRTYTLEEAKNIGIINYYDEDESDNEYSVNITYSYNPIVNVIVQIKEVYPDWQNEIVINPFKLSNIDDMRLNLLSYHTLGAPYKIDSNYTDLPYATLTGYDDDQITFNHYDLNGIMLKTYQADMFNAWVNADWIDGENGIAEMSKIAVTDGAVYMDALLLAEKTYNMLNRIAIAGGTYEAWQDVVYTETKSKVMEAPIYCGGLSNEIVFEEIIQTTPTDGAPLGTLGGRGIAVKRKGGNVSIKVDEASFIMGIVSITPRVYYGQGNEFYMTDLESMDDLHKPSLDGIGFQDLIGERMCWTDTLINKDGAIIYRSKVGKIPAWTEYMTAVDKAYGEFLDLNKQGSMILNRNYKSNAVTGVVEDFTTYIDPAKYNYVFGNAKLDAQNFWVQIDFDIKARRLMSAKQIPNL